MGCHGAGDRRARRVGVASALVRRQKRTAISSVTAYVHRWLDKRGVLCRDRTRVCGIPIAREAQTSNLQVLRWLRYALGPTHRGRTRNH